MYKNPLIAMMLLVGSQQGCRSCKKPAAAIPIH